MRWLGIMAMLWVGAAQAQQVDPQAVRVCFADTPVGEVAPSCLGAASNRCQQQGFDTTLGITECIMAETGVWDELLNREYKAVRSMFEAQGAGTTSGAGSLKDSLLTAQRAWIAYRDAECALAYARWADGSLRTIVGANCHLTMTAQRAFELRDMKEN